MSQTGQAPGICSPFSIYLKLTATQKADMQSNKIPLAVAQWDGPYALWRLCLLH